MSDFQYKRAPITEAVVEFRSAVPVEGKKRKKALEKLKKLYSQHKPLIQKEVKFEIAPQRAPKTQETDSVVDRLLSDDISQQLHITDISFLVSQLAPYKGWKQFEQRITRDWESWGSVVGFRPVERVGMRYINRIDLPLTENLVHYEHYLTVYPALPPLLDPSVFHSINVKVVLEDIQSLLSLQSALVQSPIPEHLAIVVDLDISRKFKIPPSNEELYSYISQARAKKNEVFEACITDKARELFK